jgi:WD40 repeat protein
VDFAHRHGIVHRDLKPANILLGGEVVRWRGGETPAAHHLTTSPPHHLTTPKVADFGLAKLLTAEAAARGDVARTVSGEVLGTPDYMAPEQAAAAGTPVGPAADVYALGATLYELLTGRPPCRADTPLLTLLQVLHEEPVSVSRLRPGVPRDLATITHKCLEKAPARRYASALALAEDLHRFLERQPIAARVPSTLDRLGKFARRNKALVGGLAATAAALVLGAVVSILFAVAEARQREVAEADSLRADANAGQAEAARQTAVREAYQARLAAALVSLNEHNLAEADGHLTAAPPELRGWEWRHLHSRLVEQGPVVLSCGGRCDLFGEFFPPGRRVVGYNRKEQQLLLMDAGTGAVLRTAADTGYPLVQPTRTGPVLVLTQPDGTVALMDEAGNLRPTRTRLDQGSTARALSPDGAALAVSWNPAVRPRPLEILDLASGRQRRRFPDTGRITWLAFSPDGRWLAAACADGRIRLWDTATGGAGPVLEGHTDFAYCLAFRPGGRELVSGSADHTVCQWDVGTGRRLRVRRGHSQAVSWVTYSPDGEWIASSSYDRSVRLWRTEGDEVILLGDHPTNVIRVGFSPDGRRIASASADVYARIPNPGRDARLWPSPELAELRVLRAHRGYVYAVAYSPDGRWFATGGWNDGVVRVWDAAGAEPLITLKAPGGTVGALAVSPDGKLVAARLLEGDVRLWEMPGGRAVGTPRRVGGYSVGDPENLAFSPDGASLAAGSQGRILFWDAATGRPRAELPAPVSGFVRLVAFSPDGTRLAVAVSQDRRVFVLARDTGSVLAVCRGHTGAVNSVCFHADGRTLLTAGADRTVRLWDAATGEPRRLPLRGHTDEVFSAVFVPGEARVVSGGRDRVLRVWDPATGDELARLPGHTDYIYCLACSPDGATVVSGSGDATVRLWDTFPWDRRLEARQERQAVRPRRGGGQGGVQTGLPGG